MTLTRILTTAQATLTHTFYVDETATNATGAVSVSVKRLDGTVVASGNATAAGPAGVYNYTLPAQGAVDILTVDWSGTIGGGARTERDSVEVVGGFIFGIAEARALPPALDATRFTTAMIAAERTAVEQECETICRQAFVPRFKRWAMDGTGLGRLTLPDINVRKLRAVSVDGVALDANQLSDLHVSIGGVISRGRYATGWWAPGVRNIVIEYEYGMDYPPEEIRKACMLRLRARLTMGDTGVPARALSFSIADGGVYRLSVPTEGQVGMPEIDAAYARNTADVWGFS